MARLGKVFDGSDDGIDLSDYTEENRAKIKAWWNNLYNQMLQKNPDDPRADLTGVIMKFPMADSYAIYMVTKNDPLTLSHVPMDDAWTVQAAHIRGINRQDVINYLHREIELNKIFNKAR